MDDAYLGLLYNSLRTITRAMNIYSRSLHKNAGVTGPQLSILLVLEAAGPMTISEISRRVHLSQGTLTGTIQRMEKNGLVTRSRSSEDKRKSTLHLAEAGQRIVASVSSPLPAEFSEWLRSDVPEWEQHMILGAVQRLAVLVSRDARGGAHPVGRPEPKDLARQLEAL